MDQSRRLPALKPAGFPHKTATRKVQYESAQVFTRFYYRRDRLIFKVKGSRQCAASLVIWKHLRSSQIWKIPRTRRRKVQLAEVLALTMVRREALQPRHR